MVRQDQHDAMTDNVSDPFELTMKIRFEHIGGAPKKKLRSVGTSGRYPGSPGYDLFYDDRAELLYAKDRGTGVWWRQHDNRTIWPNPKEVST